MNIAIGYGVSVFVGLVAGVIVQVIVDLVRDLFDVKRKKSNLKFEIECNIKKIDEWMETLSDLRNKFNAGRTHEFYGYFDFSSAIFVAVNRYLNDGTLYRCMSEDNLKYLQDAMRWLSVNAETMCNSHINTLKQPMVNVTPQAQAYELSNFIDFWDRTLKQCRDGLNKILAEL